MTVWITDDARRLPVKLKAEVGGSFDFTPPAKSGPAWEGPEGGRLVSSCSPRAARPVPRRRTGGAAHGRACRRAGARRTGAGRPESVDHLAAERRVDHGGPRHRPARDGHQPLETACSGCRSGRRRASCARTSAWNWARAGSLWCGRGCSATWDRTWADARRAPRRPARARTGRSCSSHGGRIDAVAVTLRPPELPVGPGGAGEPEQPGVPRSGPLPRRLVLRPRQAPAAGELVGRAAVESRHARGVGGQRRAALRSGQPVPPQGADQARMEHRVRGELCGPDGRGGRGGTALVRRLRKCGGDRRVGALHRPERDPGLARVVSRGGSRHGLDARDAGRARDTAPLFVFRQKDRDSGSLRWHVLGGVRYTFVSGVDARIEYVHQDAGYSKRDFLRQAASRSSAAPNPAAAEPYTTPGSKFPGGGWRSCRCASWTCRPPGGSRVQGRYLASLTDGSGVAFVTVSGGATDRVTLFCVGRTHHGAWDACRVFAAWPAPASWAGSSGTGDRRCRPTRS